MASLHRTAAILSIGDELTLGQTLDTNSRWLSDQLLSRGIVTIEHATVPDDREATARAITRLAAAADIVIVTGGLGPTADDLTRQALADAMSDQLIEDARALQQVTAWFASRSATMREINKVQALRPSRGEALPNPNGTAPGLFGSVDYHDVYCLPGPPREMKPMFEAQVVPRLRPARSVATKALHTFGLGESEIASRLGTLMDRGRNPVVGTTASQGIVSCRIRYESEASDSTAAAAIADTESQIHTHLGAHIFGTDSETLPSVILSLLKSRREQLATVESCTGGLLGQLITDIPGSSAAYLGGWVTYTNEFKSDFVGVPESHFAPDGPGAVSRETAIAMAVGGLERSGADHCLAITGIAGPDGGTPDKPVGTVWIARASIGLLASTTGSPVPPRTEARRLQVNADRATIRDYSAKAALAMLRFYLIGKSETTMMRQVK